MQNSKLEEGLEGIVDEIDERKIGSNGWVSQKAQAKLIKTIKL